MASIVLNDIPFKKYQLQLDVLLYPVDEEFRGFQNVLQGFHGVKVIDSENDKSYLGEILLPEVTSVEVLRIEGDSLKPDESKEAEVLKKQAKASAIDRYLINVLDGHSEVCMNWMKVTSDIDGPLESFMIFDINSAGSSRFLSFLGVHGGDLHTALREFQLIFARMVLREEQMVADHFERFLHFHLTAGDRSLSTATDYLIRFADNLTAMIALQPGILSIQSVVDYSDFIIEDMNDISVDTGDEDLCNAAKTLEEAFKRKK